MVTWSAVVALSIALVTVMAATACLIFIDFFGAIIVLPISLGTFTGVGLMLALRRPGHPIGWLFLVAGAGWMLRFALPAYAWRALVGAPGMLPAGELAVWLGEVTLLPAVGATVMGVVLFPTGRVPSRVWTPVLFLVGAMLAAALTTGAFAPEPIALQPPWIAGGGPGPHVTTPNPLGVGGPVGDALLALEPFLRTATGVPLLVLILAAPVLRIAGSSDVERLQLKWFAYAASFSVVLLITGFALPTSTVGKLAWALGMVALGLIPVGAGIAILRHRLFDIDLLISRSLSYAVLSGVVVALYLVTVTLLGAVFRQPEDPFVSAVAVLVVAVLLNPLRRRLQRATDHVIYGERDEPYAVVRELGRRLGEALDPDAVLPTVARTVARSLRLPYVGIELMAGEEGRIIASHGTPAVRRLGCRSSISRRSWATSSSRPAQANMHLATKTSRCSRH